MNEILSQLKNKLIVSCQAEGNSPFNSPEGVTNFAIAAQSAGASGIRSEGITKTKMILQNINLPIIGLIKSKYEDGFVRITGTRNDVENLLSIGTHIIAIDGTFRKREGLSGPDFINKIKNEYNCIIMADISTVKEGVECTKAGADCISTTLSGYTQETQKFKTSLPDFETLHSLSQILHIPVFAEGRINSPKLATLMKNLGAWSVVVGSSITRPAIITKWFVDALEKTT